ncbi:MAG TPA: carboxypeptidase-like regulatory domain-containing protein [Pyrinomonadaceae bacterium]|nr:carboxypeptidase-like regulatory domain-containing protein [Pyrinomonadaceae bacterium]
MHRRKFILSLLALSLFVSGAATAGAQKKQKNPPTTTGGVSGRIRVDSGASASGVSVQVRRGDEEVAATKTNAKGEFEVQGLAPGNYGLTFRKTGLQVGKVEDINVRAGKTVSLKDRLFLPIDEGSLALLRGSVFNVDGLSLPGARVELARVEPDGSLKKLDSRVSNSTGSFGFKLPPDRARYRLTVKADDAQTTSQDVEVDGAAIYRVALTLNPAAK